MSLFTNHTGQTWIKPGDRFTQKSVVYLWQWHQNKIILTIKVWNMTLLLLFDCSGFILHEQTPRKLHLTSTESRMCHCQHNLFRWNKYTGVYHHPECFWQRKAPLKHGGPLLTWRWNYTGGLWATNEWSKSRRILPCVRVPWKSELSSFVFCPVSRLEEREAELKKEYNALHQRHTEVSQSSAVCQATHLNSGWEKSIIPNEWMNELFVCVFHSRPILNIVWKCRII